MLASQRQIYATLNDAKYRLAGGAWLDDALFGPTGGSIHGLALEGVRGIGCVPGLLVSLTERLPALAALGVLLDRRLATLDCGAVVAASHLLGAERVVHLRFAGTAAAAGDLGGRLLLLWRLVLGLPDLGLLRPTDYVAVVGTDGDELVVVGRNEDVVTIAFLEMWKPFFEYVAACSDA